MKNCCKNKINDLFSMIDIEYDWINTEKKAEEFGVPVGMCALRIIEEIKDRFINEETKYTEREIVKAITKTFTKVEEMDLDFTTEINKNSSIVECFLRNLKDTNK